MAIATIVAVILHAILGRAQPRESPPWAEFGISVAALSDTIFVAASPMKGGTRGPGEIHVFQRRTSGWGRADILSVPAATVEDLFGVSMAADDDTLVVGAQFADTHGEDAGMAYVFERRNASWRQVGVLAASDAAAGDQFGLTVSLSGDTIVVGARLADSRASDTGAAYVFGRKNGTWHQVGKLVASDAASGDIFGRVSVDQDAMVLSADLNDDRGSNAGKAYAFQKRGGVWDEVARLTASDGAAGDEFGISLALKGGTAVFGALGSGGDGSGAAYVFERRDGRWAQLARLTASDASQAPGVRLFRRRGSRRDSRRSPESQWRRRAHRRRVRLRTSRRRVDPGGQVDGKRRGTSHGLWKHRRHQRQHDCDWDAVQRRRRCVRAPLTSLSVTRGRGPRQPA